MNYANYTNLFSLSKTLCNKLIPIGKTEQNFMEKKLLETDKERAEQYKTVKALMDRYHKDYIERSLSSFSFDENELLQYEDFYANSKEKAKELDKLQKDMCKSVSKHLAQDDEYGKLFKKDIITELLPKYSKTKEERNAVKLFSKFVTYFTGFFSNRKNMYSGDCKSTEIGYRIAVQNLPKFLDNLKVWETVKQKLPSNIIDEVDTDLHELIGLTSAEIFDGVYAFNHFIAQSGIDRFNQYIGGYTCDDGTQVQGLNQKINLYCQQTKIKIPKFKPLFKQILSERETVSFIPESFENDTEVLKAIQKFYYDIQNTLSTLGECIKTLSDENAAQIYVKSDNSINSLSQIIFENWSVFSVGRDLDYSEKFPQKAKQDNEKYANQRDKFFKAILNYSLRELAEFAEKYPYELKDGFAKDIDIFKAIHNYENELKTKLFDAEKPMVALWSVEKYTGKKLAKDDETIDKIKAFLDALKDYQHFIELFIGSENESDKDPLFYGEFAPAYEQLKEINHLYDKVRNYITKKPYSTNKIKLNFNNPQLLGGWDKNKESDCSCVLLMKNSKYYLGVMENNRAVFKQVPSSSSDDCYQKVVYKLLPGPNKMLPKVFFSKKGLDTFNPPMEIIDIYKKASFKSGNTFNIADCHKLIDFYKDGINRHTDWKNFGFEFSDTKSYTGIQDFFREIHDQGYSIKYENIPTEYIDEKIESGELYLFQIYNKDFSEHSHGKPNLHTIYFKALFDENNLADVCFKMNGEAEMFYREPSLKLNETTIHPKNQPLKNKNDLNPKKSSTFNYDIIKDRRYTKPQFSLHLPITMNFKAQDYVNLNQKVRQDIAASEDIHVIGIDRGERNLLYISVINSKGEIVEQESLNEIVNHYNDSDGKMVESRTNYQNLLASKEKDRLDARKNWKTIEGIKELKEGYLSQAVHKICEWVLKYNAIIVMENLNSGFKNARSAVERSVYQKFEKMLTDKLAFLADKSKDITEVGGILNAYQLAIPKTSYSEMQGQNGIIFYVDPWLTSKIDPLTGFSNQYYAKYESVEKSKAFFEAFDHINYNAKTNRFEFEVTKTIYGQQTTRKIETYDKRIESFRNKDKNSSWDCREVDVTEELKQLFEKFGVDYRDGDLREKIALQDGKPFFAKLIHLFNLTVQLRNSKPNSTDPAEDYLISPVCNADGVFFDSRNAIDTLPKDADANGAYNIARKGLMLAQRAKSADDTSKALGGVRRAEWLQYATECPIK